MEPLRDIKQMLAAGPTIAAAAHPDAVVHAPGVRFTVLTPRLLRLEHDPAGAFEDRPSQVFWARRQPVPDYRVERAPGRIEIDTGALRLRYAPSERGLVRDRLSVEVAATGARWQPGDPNPGNLGGTVRTLDGADGAVQLEPGLMSRSGWVVVDDSAGLVFDARRGVDGRGWLVPRDGSRGRDLYFFGYGRDYLGCLRDFYRVAGPVPLVPRWILGNWWSRYWAYRDVELRRLVDDFRAHDVPLSVLVVDMDWHVTDSPTSSGWTGYTWNRALFPEPAAFLDWVHAQGLRVTLNLHPAQGVHPHEEAYAAMARRLGLDLAPGEPIAFDATDPAFVRAYFELLHHPREAEGVDFWWIDWQQGERTRVPGLDPLWWLNHLHFYDRVRADEGSPRPLIFSRWGGLGSHRYPIGFSGDTVVSWASLAFQPEFTATAANVGYGWWSHDIGGHMYGIEDPELYTRWVQYGVFSPVLRLHSTKNPYHERRPWGYDAEVARITRAALQLRHRLIPYLYAAAWRAVQAGHTPILPLYYRHPDDEAAYHCPNAYYFGPDLIAAPYVRPRAPDTRLSRQDVWLPPGEWYELFSGEAHAGGRWHAFYGALDDIPVLARAGAIVPLAPATGWGGVGNPDALTLHVFAGAAGAFDLYEDDGESNAYLDGAYGITRFEQVWGGDSLRLTVGAARGDHSLVPAERTYHLAIHGVRAPARVQLAVDGAPRPAETPYDPHAERLDVRDVRLRPDQTLTLVIEASAGEAASPPAAGDDGQGLLSRRDRRAETFRARLRAFRLDTAVKGRLDGRLPELLDGRASLDFFAADLTGGQLRALERALETV